MGLGVWVWGLGVRGLGVRVLGVRGLGVRVLGVGGLGDADAFQGGLAHGGDAVLGRDGGEGGFDEQAQSAY
ncbi:hypothetical protein Ahu01nite_041910 [Winogradskya humida]|uniref:Uncharacterized protein n=1 Tax=Winogradskya humida TaxID=113566 RepID=A0ABQ3ZRB1_9ACTN|nr:hypothetical protein Ahu01nite_041910 [Actinoplanes humidus]